MSENKFHILSKSTFVYGCQCPKRLYLHKFKPEVRNEEDEEQLSIFSTGTNIGLLAQGLYPGGVNAEPPDSFSYAQSVSKTKELIASGINIIYEAAFIHNQVLCAIDILVKENNHWYAFEVKSTSKVKEPHITDAALQYYVITNSGIPLKDISIVHLNTKYFKDGELDVNQLFTKSSILNEVLELQSFVDEKTKSLIQLVKDKTEPIIEVGDHCNVPYSCDFSDYCNQGIEQIEEISDRPENIDSDYIQSFLDELEYPLYFFDFETVMPVVPEFDFSRPYQQIPFQYSVHLLKTPKSKLEHYEFLGDGVSDPRPELTKQLVKCLGKSGSIIVWNQGFEKTRLRELALMLPKYAEQLEAINERIVDLMNPFRKKAFYKRDFNESYSIKVVLPVLVPGFSYDSLAIQNGGDASAIYANLKNMPIESIEQTRKDLLEYCKLDTLAMVKILQHLTHTS